MLRFLQQLHPDAAYALLHQPQAASHQKRNVHFAAVDKRTAVINAHHLTAPRLDVHKPDHRAERKSGMSGGERKHIEGLSTSGQAAIELGAVPTDDASPNLNRLNSLAGMSG